MKKDRIKNLLSLFFVLLVFAICILGCKIFSQKIYSWIAISGVLVLCGIFFFIFEHKKTSSSELAIIAVLTALSVVGRAVFASLPGFKPCSAIIIISGIYFGKENGFMVGALTPLISNFYYGQGMWTPFQMTAWGLIGFGAGLLSRQLSKNKILLLIYGAFSGALFSVIMDLWSVIWADNKFSLSRYLVLMLSSLKFTLIYMLSNVIFLLVFIEPSKRIFKRLDLKFNIGTGNIQ